MGVKSSAKWGAAALAAAILIVWEVAGRLLGVTTSTYPSRVFAALPGAVVDEGLFRLALLSTWHLVAGVAVGGGLGLCASLAASRWPRLDALLTPSTQFLAPIPVVVWIPFAVVVFGTGQASIIALVALAAYFLVYFQVSRSLEDVRAEYAALADLYEKTYAERLRHLFLPPATASLAAGLRITLVIGWLVLIGTERGGGETAAGGLGYYLTSARLFGRIEQVFCAALVLAVIAFGFDAAVTWVGRRLTSWDTKKGFAKGLTLVNR